MCEPKVSPDPEVNWKNDSIQFPRLIAELEAQGVFTPPALDELARSMDLRVKDVCQLVDRAVDVWDGIKTQIPAAPRQEKGRG